MRTKNDYQQMIKTYGMRKAAMKTKHPKSAKRTVWLRNLRRKMDNWRRAVKRHERVEERMEEACLLVMEFTGVYVKRIGASCNRRDMDARKLFYKYCIENHIQGRKVAWYCGMKWLDAPSAQRLRFTRSFKTNPANLKLWREFKNFCEHRKYQQAA